MKNNIENHKTYKLLNKIYFINQTTELNDFLIDFT